ncbi:MAG TPA: hypothetical protein VJN93_08750 [Candidatus Acidoferrum sp.]|nr:hypothetical protein [Candidatus Acidoferrum sp.]
MKLVHKLKGEAAAVEGATVAEAEKEEEVAGEGTAAGAGGTVGTGATGETAETAGNLKILQTMDESRVTGRVLAI